MLNKINILFILLLTVLSLQANQVEISDSLINLLDDTKGTERMEILHKLSNEHMDNSVEDAIKYANELLQLADKEGNLKYKDLACSFLGELYFYIDEIDKSIKYFEKFLETNIEQKDSDGIATAYNNLGIVYRYIEKYEESINSYLKSLKLKEELNDTVGLCNTLNNIGVLYFFLNDYNRALEYYNRSYKIEKSLNNKSGIATSLLNIGEVYSNLNKSDRALAYFLQSIEISKEINDNHTLEVNYNCLYEMYKKKVDFQKALYYYELFTELHKERLDQETHKEIAELEIRYETSEKQKEIELLNKQNKFKKWIIILLFVTFIVFSLMIIMLFKQIRSRKEALKELSLKNQKITEQSKVLSNLNITKDKFFSIISHDLKGAIGGFLTQTEFLSEDFNNLAPHDMLDLLKRMNQSSKQLYSLLENLLEWSKTQTGKIEPKPEKFNLSDLIEETISLFKNHLLDKEVKIISNIETEINVFADFNMISTVLRNIILNAIKFSYPKSTININVEINISKVSIEIKDEGVGMLEKDMKKLFDIGQSFSNPGTNREKGSGLGLIICKEFVEQNGGKIKVNSKYKEGSSFVFTLNLA
jgi:signal transduction histidine kinase